MGPFNRAGVFGRLVGRRPVILELKNSLYSDVGQLVIVGLPEALLLRLVIRLYLLPLLAGLAGAALGHYISFSNGANAAMMDGAALVGAIAAGAAMLLINRRREIEFPTPEAVHVLRHVERPVTDVCAGQVSNEQ